MENRGVSAQAVKSMIIYSIETFGCDIYNIDFQIDN